MNDINLRTPYALAWGVVSNAIFKLYLRNTLPKNVSLFLVSNLNRRTVENTGFFEYSPDVDFAIDFARKKLRTPLEICIIPHGTLIIPVITEETT